jgi:hypothetical protein
MKKKSSKPLKKSKPKAPPPTPQASLPITMEQLFQELILEKQRKEEWHNTISDMSL